MTRPKVLAGLLLGLIATSRPGQANGPEAAKTTTDLGLTVTAEQVLDSMLELDSFWPPVRNYISGERFPVSDRETRRQAVGMIKKIDDQMSDRLFSEDVAVGQDLFAYVAARLRKYEFLRQLAAVVADDSTMIDLKIEWDRALEEVYRLPEGERAERLTANAIEMRSAMQMAGMPDDKAQAAMPLWDLLAQATLKVDATEAGRRAVAFECEIIDTEDNAAQLACRILEATEWALIAKPADENLSRRHFLAAWDILDRHSQPRSNGVGGGQ